MQEKDLKKIIDLFKETDPLLKRKIYSQSKRYESLDDLIVDYEEIINEQRRKQKLLDMWFEG